MNGRKSIQGSEWLLFGFGVKRDIYALAGGMSIL